MLGYLLTLGEPILEHVIIVLKGNDRFWQFNIIECLLDDFPRDIIITIEN